MNRSNRLFGLLGLLALLFAAISYFLVGTWSAYPSLHLAIGVVFLAIYLSSGLGELGELLSARSTKQGASALFSSLLFLLLLVALNWLGVRHNYRLDLTEQGVFTLAPQARNVLRMLEEEIELQAFLEGGRDPAIEAILESFDVASDRVEVRLVDPDRRPELTQRYGIRSYGTVRVQYGEQSTTVAAPDEQSLTNAIIKVTRTEIRTLCFLQGEGEPSIDDDESPSGFGVLRAALRNEQYRVSPLFLAQEEEVPPDCSIVVVGSPERPLSDRERGALENFLDTGGRALLLLSPGTGSELAPLLAGYSIELGEDVVVDEVVRLFEGPTLGLKPLVEDYGDHPITGNLRDRTIFPVGRSITPIPGPTETTTTVLASTSAGSWAESDLVTLFEQSQAAYDEGDTPGPIPVAIAAESSPRPPGERSPQTRLVVFGTSAVADNQHLDMLFNRDLVLNAFAWLGGQEELVAIRARSLRTSRIRFDAGEATTIFYLSVLVLPELLLMLGVAIWWRRSRL